MAQTIFDPPAPPLAAPADRRTAVRALGALGAAILAALGLDAAAAKRNDRHRNAGHKSKRHDRALRSGRRQALDAFATEATTSGAALAGPVGPDGAAVEDAGRVQAERKRKTKRGPTGPTGPSPASITRFGPAQRETGIFVRSLAQCEPGEHAVGGGYFLALEDPSQTIEFIASLPEPFEDGTVPTGWAAEANATAPGGDKEIRAFAVCVPD